MLEGGWVREPYNERRVLEYFHERDEPLLAREIQAGTGLVNSQVQKALDRLSRKGFLTRWQIPVQCGLPTRFGDRRPIPGGATRLQYLYALVEGDNEA